MKMENVDAKAIPTIDDLDRELLSSEAISSKKLEEFIDLIKLKLAHPEFENDITLQLKNFTKNENSTLGYEDGFSISEIEQLGKSKVISDSLEQLILGFTVITNSESFKDSILTEIKSKNIELDGTTRVSKTVLFLPFSEQ